MGLVIRRATLDDYSILDQFQDRLVAFERSFDQRIKEGKVVIIT